MTRAQCFLGLVALTCLCTASITRAESIFGFAYLGGDVRSYDGRIEAKGGAGMAHTDSLSAATKIAPQLLDLRLVTVSVVGNYQSTVSEDAFGSVRRRGMQIPSFRVGMPLGRRAAFGVGFQAMRATQWESEQRVEQGLAGLAGPIEFRKREGTQFAVPIELAFELHRKLRIGGGLLYEGGTVRMRYELDIPDAVVDPVETREDTQESLTWTASAMLRDIGPLSLGGYYVPKHDAEVEVDVRGVAADARSNTIRDDKRPARWGVGLEMELPAAWKLAVDYEGEDWSQYEGRAFYDEDGDETGLYDERRYSAGIERRPPRRVRGFFNRQWRAGAYFREWNYGMGGSQLEEWGWTLGTSVAFRALASRADLGFGYARIGDLDENGVTESVIRFYFSISGGEKWY